MDKESDPGIKILSHSDQKIKSVLTKKKRQNQKVEFIRKLD